MDSLRVIKPTLPQVSVRVPDEIRAAFTAYADRLELNASDVANLLILREKRLRRLAALHLKGKPPERVRQPRGEAVPRRHITVYFRSLAKTVEFENYAGSCGLKRTDALAWLLKAEIKERWLERVLRRK
jgi:hypothetical protein